MHRRNLVLMTGLAALAAAAYLWLSRGPGPDEAPVPADEASAGVAAGPALAPGLPPAQPGPLEAGERSGGVAPPAEAAAPANAAPPGTPSGSAQPGAVPSGTEGSGTGKPAEGAPAESKAMANKEDIRAAVLELRGQIKECFEQGLKANPDLDGTVKVEFVLARSPDGGAYAREGEINDSSLAAPLVEACILSKIQTAKFKELKGEGEVRVRYPFRLSADTAAGFGGQ